jgi:serine/threonine protein kinase
MGDEQLRREVESLLSRSGSVDDATPLDRPAWVVAAEPGAAASHTGTRLGAYLIETLLGTGGMGEVYRAQDTRLHRSVAIKFLNAELTDKSARRRFQKEAQAASALNHPHIVTVHEAGESDGLQYLVMEYVDGGTLRQWVRIDNRDWLKVLELLVGVADALACAHEAGILHRDIKPDNILVAKSGYAKLSDFGLAKLIGPPSPAQGTHTLTNPGMIAGTVAYMSPEQAVGRAVDARSDVFALGVVLYELFAGCRPFQGANDLEVLHTVIHQTAPALAGIRPDLPKGLTAAIEKALEKDPEQRYQSMREMVVDLRRVIRQAGSGEAAKPTPSRKRPAVVALASACALIAGGAAYKFLGSQPSSRPAEFTYMQVTDSSGRLEAPRLSPDGRSVVYSRWNQSLGHSEVFVQRIGGNPTNLTKDALNAGTPVFSPDGEQIALSYTPKGGVRGLYVMGATGEALRRLTDDCTRHSSWSPDGREIVCSTGIVQSNGGPRQPNSRLWRVDVATGEKRLLSDSDGVQPDWSPHGYRIAYAANAGGESGPSDIWTMTADGRGPIPVTQDPSIDLNPRWAPDGKHLYFVSNRGGNMNLWRTAIDEISGHVLGPAEPVTMPATDLMDVSFSRDGKRIAYVQTTTSFQLYKLPFDPVAEQALGAPVAITQGSKPHRVPSLSPDGEWLAYCSLQKPEDISVVGSDGSGLRVLIHDGFVNQKPQWSPDRNNPRIAFLSDRSGRNEIWLIRPDGSGLHRLTYTTGTADQVTGAPVWSPDGKHIAYSRVGKSPAIIEVDKPWNDQRPIPIAPYGTPEIGLLVTSWSPDGRHLGLNLATGDGSLVYDFASRAYSRIPKKLAMFPVWLNDGRRVLITDSTIPGLEIIDLSTGRVKVLLSTMPMFTLAITISPDNRTIYFGGTNSQSDIWLATSK